MSTGMLANLVVNADTFRDASRVRNFAVLRSLLGPAYRGFVKRVAAGKPFSDVSSTYDVRFDWT